MGSTPSFSDSVQPPQEVVLPALLAEYSRFVQRIRRRYAAELPLLRPGLPRRVTISVLVERLMFL